MAQGLAYWMSRHKYDSIDVLRGSLNLRRFGDTETVEVTTFVLWSSHEPPTAGECCRPRQSKLARRPYS